MRALARRALTVPLYLSLFAASLAALPVALPLAAAVDRWRGTPYGSARSLLFFVWYLGCEAAGLAAAGAFWLAKLAVRPTRARWLAWHVRLECWWARQLVGGAARIFRLRFEVEGDDALGPGPLLLFMRHASTADTILTSAILTDRRGLEFRHVMKRELLWDPCLDVVGNRLPNYFVDRESSDSAREIAGVQSLAHDLGPGEGVLIYPEGTRFTEEKRARVLARLAQRGERDLWQRASGLRHVLPPRLGGPLGLLQARPGCDVAFCAHVGFDGVRSFGDFLRGELVGQTVRIAYWRVPGDRVPSERDAQIDWLFEQWRRVDAWVGAHRKSGSA